MTPLSKRSRHRAVQQRKRAALLLAMTVVLSACATDIQSGNRPPQAQPNDPNAAQTVNAGTQTPRTPISASPQVPASPTPATMTNPPPTTTPTSSTASSPSVPATNAPLPTTTTIADPLEGVFDRACVRQATPEKSLEQVASTLDDVSVVMLWAENGFADRVGSGGFVDVCVGNAIDDITGQTRPTLGDPQFVAALRANVERQQTKLNELFTPWATPPIAVDGISGPITGQRLCAADWPSGSRPQSTTCSPARTNKPCCSLPRRCRRRRRRRLNRNGGHSSTARAR